jgi:hypothetical protein
MKCGDKGDGLFPVGNRVTCGKLIYLPPTIGYPRQSIDNQGSVISPSNEPPLEIINLDTAVISIAANATTPNTLTVYNRTLNVTRVKAVGVQQGIPVCGFMIKFDLNSATLQRNGGIQEINTLLRRSHFKFDTRMDLIEHLIKFRQCVFTVWPNHKKIINESDEKGRLEIGTR